jgi:hypothetical protein
MNSPSTILYDQAEDLHVLYEKARDEENGGLMEKLSKAYAELLRKARDQETYERESIKRQEFLVLINDVGEVIGTAIERIEEEELRVAVRAEISKGIKDLIERTFSNDD